MFRKTFEAIFANPLRKALKSKACKLGMTEDDLTIRSILIVAIGKPEMLE